MRESWEKFERIAGRVECFDLLTVEARRARGREERLDAALRDAPHKDSCRTGQDGPTGGCDCGKVAALELEP